MKKILIVYNYILHYRKPFFNELSKQYDVTVLHSGEPTVTSTDCYKEIITPVKKIGPFYFQHGVFQEVRNKKYDVIISLFDVRWVAILLFLLCKDDSKFHILWGAWITQSKIANKVRGFFLKRSNANVFYTFEAKRDFAFLEIPDEKMYVANNTFDVGSRIKAYEYPVKNRILFVGSLDSRKENEVLFRAFSNIQGRISSNINLTVIGSGSEQQRLQKLAQSLGILDRVLFEGRLDNPDKLKAFYNEAIVSVSYGQAGLSVLQSMGFGVPFMTKISAISGGEKSNIKSNVNGVLCDDNQSSLENNLVMLCRDIDKARKLGASAYNYYEKYCTIENMAQGFIDAIEGSNHSRVDSSN